MASDLIYLSVLYQVGGEGWCVGGKPPYSMQVAAYKKEQDAIVASCQARGGAARSLMSGAPRSPNHEMSFKNGNFLPKVQDFQWPSAPVISSRRSSTSQPSSTSDVHPVLRAAAANATGLCAEINTLYSSRKDITHHTTSSCTPRSRGLQTAPLPCAHLTQQHEAGHAGTFPGSTLL